MVRAKWWKILGVIIVLYSIVVGMIVPLKPGIVKVKPGNARTGEKITLEVVGYNSHYEEGEVSMRAWLKLDNERALKAEAIEVSDDRTVALTFDIPPYLPITDRVKDLSLIIDNEVDGASILPSAFFITQDSIDPEAGQVVWPNSPIEYLNSHPGITFPFRNILKETIRNAYFHISLWLSMMIIFIGSVTNSIKYLLSNNNLDYDRKALAMTAVGVFWGLLGLITGAIWAKNTWGQYWSWDVKQNMTVIALLIYCAYFVLRSSFEDPEKKARLSAVYNIFAFVALIPLIYVIPRLSDSLHPGAGGNPALGGEDLDNTMRMVFYPAVIGWTLIGLWIASLKYRIDHLRAKIEDTL